jgi:isoleucyl-tRNA synthetase
MKLLEEERARGTIGSALDAAVIMSVSDEKERIFLKDNSGLLTAILKVSDVEIKHGDPEGAHIPNFSAKVKIEKAKGMKCPRCWNYTLTVGHNSLFPDICSRCADAVTERSAV